MVACRVAEVNFAFDRVGSRGTGSTMSVATLRPASGQPEGEAAGIVAGFIPTIVRR